MSVQPRKRESSTTQMFQLVCLLGLATSALSSLDACVAPECQQLAASIEANVDHTVNPCDDFYQHACGNFIKTHNVPYDKVAYSTMIEYSLNLKEKLYNLLEEPELPDDSVSIKKIKKQYKICKDPVARETAGLTTLLNAIRDNGGWPMIVPDVFPYHKSYLEVQDDYNRKTGNGPLYTVLIYSRAVDSADNAITLDQPYVFPKKTIDLSTQENAAKFVKYIADVANEFAKADGVDIPRERLEEDARNVFDFMRKLNATRNPDEWRKRGPSMTVTEAQEAIKNGTSTPFFLLTALQRLYRDVPDVTVTKDEVINVRELEYMQGLVKLLRQTSPVTILNYIHFHFVHHYLPITTAAIRKHVAEVFNSGATNRTIQCASLPNVDAALGRMFVKRYVPESTKIAAENVVKDLKEQIEYQIERTSFLDAATRKKALAKLKNLVSIVGYTDAYKNDVKVDEYYAKYKISDDLVETMLNYHEVEYKKDLEELRVPIVRQVVRTTSRMDPTLDVGMYAVRFNKLELPSGLLETPLFSENYPALSNLAGFGQVAGTLLADLYIFLGSEFDDEGNVVAWASPAAYAEFEKREQCFTDLYSNTTIKELADAGLSYNLTEFDYRPVLAQYHFALKTAYLAHRAKLRPLGYKTNRGPANQRLTLQTTVDKQFFYNFAHTFCQSVNPSMLFEALDHAIPHVPTGRIKVNSALANLPEFAQVFGCAPNSPMNPPNKCTILD